MKWHKSGSSVHRNVFSEHSGGWESKIKVSSQVSLLGLQMAIFSLCPPVVSPVGVSVPSSPLLVSAPVRVDVGAA